MATSRTAKKTATKTATKGRAKAKTAKSTTKASVAETTPLENLAATAQERYFSMLEQGQTAALEGFETIVETIGQVSDRISKQVTDLELPSIPGIDALPKLNIPSEMPANMVDTYFEFANKALTSQREFANKMLANQRQFADKALAISSKS